MSLRVDGDVAEIGRLAVAPDRQGEGIGTRLMREIEARAPAAVRELRLFTGEHSAGNLRLYTRLGYRETGRRNVGNHDIVFLAKALGGLDDGLRLADVGLDVDPRAAGRPRARAPRSR